MSEAKSNAESKASQAADQKEEPGLVLSPQLTLKQLSGPVSYYYLKPTEEAVQAYKAKNVHLPLVLLFGDRHRSIEKRCTLCGNPAHNPYCMRIEDPHFLKAIDGLAEKTPIDFYVEHAPFMDNLQSEGQGVMFDLLVQKAVTLCHRVPKRITAEYTMRCPTSQLRWHYADSRFMYHYKEGCMYLLSIYIRQITGLTSSNELKQAPHVKRLPIQSFSSFLYQYDSLPNEAQRNEWHDTALELDRAYITQLTTLTEWDGLLNVLRPKDFSSRLTLVLQCSEILKKTKQSPQMSHLHSPHPEIMVLIQQQLMDSQQEDLLGDAPLLIYYTKIILRSLTVEAQIPLVLDHFIAILRYIRRVVAFLFSDQFLFKESPHLKSGIQKQISKQSISKEEWQEAFVQNILHSSQMMSSFFSALHIAMTVHNEMKLQREGTVHSLLALQRKQLVETTRTYIDFTFHSDFFMNIYYHLFYPFEVSLLDIYTLARMMKRPTEGVSGTLAIGYFGAAHAKHMVNHLTRMGYTVEAEEDHTLGNNMSRCLIFQDRIDLHADVAEYAGRRNAANQSLYLQQMANEKAKRATIKSVTSKQNAMISSQYLHHRNQSRMFNPNKHTREEAILLNIEYEGGRSKHATHATRKRALRATYKKKTTKKTKKTKRGQ